MRVSGRGASNPIRNVFITLEQFAEIQSKYDGVCEYLNGEILFSSRTSRQHNRVVRKILTTRCFCNV